MKSNRKKRILAAILCMVMVLTNNFSILAETTGAVDNTAEIETPETEVSEEVIPEEAEPEESVKTPEIPEEVVQEESAKTPEEPEEVVQEEPAKTPEVPEEVVPEEPAKTPEEPEEVVPEEPAKTPEEEKLPVKFEKEIDGLKVTVTAEKDTVLPEEAILSVEKIEDAKEVEEIKEAIAPELIKEKSTIKDMIALDIKFLVQDGKELNEIQPNGEVQVEIQNMNLKEEKGLSVYHVDEKKKEATDMQAVENKTAEDVVFDTTHFSKYVVINKGKKEVDLTIKHYLEGESTPLYRDDEVTLPVYEDVDETKLKNFTAEDEQFELAKIVKWIGTDVEEFVPGDKKEEITVGTVVDTEAIIICYYRPTKGTTINETTFFDYDRRGYAEDNKTVEEELIDGKEYTLKLKDGKVKVQYDDKKEAFMNLVSGRIQKQLKADTQFEIMVNDKHSHTCTYKGDGKYSYKQATWEAGINAESNYPANSSAYDRIEVGQGYNIGYEYNVKVKDKDGQYRKGVNINTNSWQHARVPITQGIVKGLSGNNYEDVQFAPKEPGLFSSEEKKGKRILEGYDLEFSRVGNTYKLKRVLDPNGKETTKAGSGFYPLKGNLGTDGDKNGGNDNWYFGMRYDFKFKLGDYVGQLQYKFNGDDDLWVFLDGELILDLGGMHPGYPKNTDNADFTDWLKVYPNTVDLWEKLLDKTTYTLEDKVSYLNTYADDEHTVTVLYMERGGHNSNCDMEFVMPNVTPREPVISITPKTDLIFIKKDTDTNELLKGVEFTLYSDKDCQESMNKVAVSDEKGTVTFNSLRAGTYYMKETKALEGYKPNKTIYKITVTENLVGTSANAVLTKVDDDQPIREIFNQKKKQVSLEITKKLKRLDKGSKIPSDAVFKIYVEINGQPYQGKYTVAGTPKETTTGVIELGHNETARIPVFESDKFLVREYIEGNYHPTYIVTGAEDVKIPGEETDVLGATGTVTGEECKVRVVNEELQVGHGTTTVTVNKKWVDQDKYSEYIPESIEVTLYEDVNHSGKYEEGTDRKVKYDNDGSVLDSVHLTADNKWTYTWINLPGDVDYVVKEECPEGFEWDITETTNVIEKFTGWKRETPCSQMEFPLGKNNAIVVKDGDQYYLWTKYNLQIEVDENSKVLDEMLIGEINKIVKGNVKDLYYQYGKDAEVLKKVGISITEAADGAWKLKFGATSAWAWFYMLQYTRSESIALENRIDLEDRTEVAVNKQWLGGQEKYVTVQLYINGKPSYKPEHIVRLDENNQWTHTFTDLEYFTEENGICKKNEYTVVEKTIIDYKVINGYEPNTGYQSSVSGNQEEGFTITNTKGWKIVKVSENGNNQVQLSGAIFKLEKNEDNGKGSTPNILYGWSGNTKGEGAVKWYTEYEETTGTVSNEYQGAITDGVYRLSEIKAPSGYSLSKENWIISVKQGVPTVTSSDFNGKVDQDIEKDGSIVFYYKNTPVYNLPSAGGPGIFGYMIGGTLLLMAAALLLYKMKREEVLKS